MSYGRCAICSREQQFQSSERNPRDKLRCENCNSPLRDRDVAQAIIMLIGEGRTISLGSLSRSLIEGARAGRPLPVVLDICHSSSFESSLGQLPTYHRAYRWASGRDETGRKGRLIRFMDVQSLDYDDASLDLIITNDVLPFVEDEARAHAEIRRVLRPGGAHVASLPLDWPVPAETRAPDPDKEGGRTYRTPDGAEVTLRRRYGADIVASLNTLGYCAFLRRSSVCTPYRRNFTLVAIRR